MNRMEQLLADKDLMIEYRKWRDDPMTKIVHDAITDYIIIDMLPDPFEGTVSPNAGWMSEKLALQERERAGMSRCLKMQDRMEQFKALPKKPMPEEDYTTPAGVAVPFNGGETNQEE